VNPFRLYSIERTHVGVVDVLKTKDTQSPRNPNMGGVQVVVGQKVHVAPFGVLGWNGTPRAHPT
jgi:hypothetical protein